jgi:hypothetical protein
MRVDARDEAGNYKLLPKLPVLQVRSASGKSADLTTHQTAPGTYEASVDVDATERLTVNLAGETSGATTRHLVPDEDSEYRLRPPDEGMLRAVATATGGEWQPTAAAIKQIAGASQVSRHAMWPWLVLAALLFWFLDVLVRRIRLFEGAFTAPVSSPAPSSRPQRA